MSPTIQSTTRISALLALSACLASLPGALAADLKAPFDLESAQVLPKGVRNPRFKLVLMNVQEKFNGAGGVEGLGQKLNKTVTWGDIIASQRTEADRAQVAGLLGDPSSGIANPGLSGSPGRTTGTVNSFANVKVPVLAMGVTDRLTLALALPIMKIDVSASTGFVANPDGERFIRAACESNPDKCNEAAAKLNDAVNQKLTSNGYAPVAPTTVSGVGDAKFVAKYRFRDDELASTAAKLEVTLPTGTPPNADRAVDVPTGDGQWDVGAGLAYDYRVTPDLTWDTYGTYTVQLPDTLERRLPVSSSDLVSDVKESLGRDLGDHVNVGTSLTYAFPRLGLKLGAGYSFQYLNGVAYRDGLKAPSLFYRWLEDDYPAQSLHAATLTAGFSTVDFYKQKQFVYPFQANLSYARPLAGRNVTTNDVLQAELVLFF